LVGRVEIGCKDDFAGVVVVSKANARVLSVAMYDALMHDAVKCLSTLRGGTVRAAPDYEGGSAVLGFHTRMPDMAIDVACRLYSTQISQVTSFNGSFAIFGPEPTSC
jgi:hypothetical protein